MVNGVRDVHDGRDGCESRDDLQDLLDQVQEELSSLYGVDQSVPLHQEQSWCMME